ncbi:hypothetical protein EV193_10573 [Herbihabitans rhizosphaerae]|uniref:CopC domain-containing protein n=1 Tax=Herbihabitans rhizosphaerae TaxID=1872711 RepID=A0A4Q7KLI0_9PSEU|nr:copper resistance CopC family protein [Herbihabitans rhizosphaerae]RZS37518.1 hypothetical protein EV193_10573 [Herbihabitans rhizosphaerae]
MRRLFAVLALAGLTMVGLATPALAHNTLIGSTPANESTVDTGPQSIELKFDQPVQGGDDLNTVVVRGPNDDRWEGGSVRVSGNVVTMPLRQLGPAGVYTIGYNIVSNDGHAVRGQVKFTLSKPGGGAPAAPDAGKPESSAPSGQAQPDSGAADGDSGGGAPVWVWIAGAVVLLGAGLVLALRLGKQQ